MSSGGGKGGGDAEYIIRYAPYLETAHSAFLTHEGYYYPIMSFAQVFNETLDYEDHEVSPYKGYEVIKPDEGFFGIREDEPSLTYEIEHFPSLWDMFGKFMAGLDVHDLWGQVYEDVIRGPEIAAAVSAHSDTLQDEIDRVDIPKFLGGMRDIGAVQSSAFIIGKALIQNEHVKQVNKFAGDIRLHALDISVQQWMKHLDWDQAVMDVYSNLFKLYYSARMDIDRVNLEYASKEALWNINLFEYARSMIGAMAGAAAAPIANEPSQMSKSIGGALSGMAAGYKSTGTTAGGMIGGVLGLGLSFI